MNDDGPELVVTGDGTKSFQALGFCMWECVLGTGNGEGKTLVAPLWRRRCERDLHALTASLGGGGVKGLRDGLGQAGSSCPVTTWTRTTTDTTVTATFGQQGWPKNKGHSRHLALWLAQKKGIVDPRNPAQNHSGPTGLHVTRPTGCSTGVGLRNWVDRGGRGQSGPISRLVPGSPAPREPRRPGGASPMAAP